MVSSEYMAGATSEPNPKPPVRLKRAQVRAIDQLAMERYQIPGVVLMENASRAVAEAAREIVRPGDGAILILCGGGNNGGDGLAAARHLHNFGYDVELLLATDPGKYHGDALVQWNIIQAMHLPWKPAEPRLVTHRPLLIDAIFGTGLDREPRPPFAEIVDAIDKSGIPVLAVDLPSGLDCDTGKPLGACIRATRTVTFVAEKYGFAFPGAKEYTGRVTVADIGCPRELISEVMGL